MYTAIAAWAEGVIEGVAGFNKVYLAPRIIENITQLEQDFGVVVSGAPVICDDDKKTQMTRGWTIEIASRQPGADEQGSAIVTYQCIYRCFWLVDQRGATGTAFLEHVHAVELALQAVPRPATLAALDLGKKPITSAVSTESAIVVWPLSSGRRHHRAELTQAIRLREQLR